MKILQLTKKLPYPAKDGETIAVMNLSAGFARLGHEVTILAINTPKHYFDVEKIPEALKKNIQWHAVFIDTGISMGGILKNLFKKIPYHIERFDNRYFADNLVTILQEGSFDIIQLEGLFLVPYIPLIKKHSTAKLIYRSHNVEGVIWKRVAQHETKRFQKWYLNLQAGKLINYEKNCLKYFDAIVPISNADAAYYEQQGYSGKIKYVPSGIDLNEMPDSSPPVNFNSLYFLGGLDWIPNQEGIRWFLEEVFPIVKASNPPVEFHIAGRNAPEWFTQLTEEGVVFHGEIADARQFIADKFICVIPLLAGSGMKIKVAEAMFAAKPVVITSIGAEGMPEGMNEHLYIADDPETFAQKITWCLAHSDEAVATGLKGKIFVETHLDNNQLATGLLKFYEELVT